MFDTYNQNRLKDLAEDMLPIIIAVAEGRCCSYSKYTDCQNNVATITSNLYQKQAQKLLDRIIIKQG